MPFLRMTPAPGDEHSGLPSSSYQFATHTKLVIHKAYGFRTAKTYIRNLYHCLADLPLPQTVHTFV